MFYFVSTFFWTVLAKTVEVHSEELEVKKTEACHRGVTVAAASRAQNLTKFYIYEEQHAWLYNAENQDLEEYAGISEKLEDEKVMFAFGLFGCHPDLPFKRDNFSIISTENMVYTFQDIVNFKNWGSGIKKTSLRPVYDIFHMDPKGPKVEDIVTADIACTLAGRFKYLEIHHFYYKDNRLRLCTLGGVCKEKDKQMGVFHPFNVDRQLKQTKKPVDALAFEHGMNEDKLGALFVSEETLHYWREHDGDSSWSEVTLTELFGCSSPFKYIAIAIVVVGIVLTLVAFTLLVALLRQKRKDHGGMTLEAPSSSVVVKNNGTRKTIGLFY